MTINKSKITESLKKNAIAIVLSSFVLCWTFIKDVFTAGADYKFRQKIEVMVTHDLKLHFDTLIDNRFDLNLKKSLSSPMLWYDALSSDYVSEYAESKAKSIRNEVSKNLTQVDSIQRGFIESLGKDLGIRDEDVLPLLEKVLKDYIKRENSTHTVRASF